LIKFRGAADNVIAADIAGNMDGKVVVFLHGGGQTRQSWHGAHEALAKRNYLSITLDARGHGESDWTTADGYTIDAMAKDLRCVIARLSRPVALVGASMGGLSAMTAFLQDPPLQCYALALVDVVPRPNGEGIAHIKNFMSASPDGFGSLEEAADAVAAYIPNRTRPASPQGLRKNLRLSDNGRYYWHWDPAFLNFRDDDFTSSPRLEEMLRTSHVPTLLVRGRESDVVTDVEAEHFAQLMPSARIVDIRGATHMVAGDQNDVFLAAIDSFLKDADVQNDR
jgi:pimeloyl-ACP methyl ester carboxylesterase